MPKGKKKSSASPEPGAADDGAGPADADGAGPAVAGADPQSIKKFVDELELETIEEWGVNEVVGTFLPAVNLATPELCEIFVKHNVRGPVLLHMTKEDIADLGLSLNGRDPLPAPKYGQGANLITLGDRIYLWELCQILQQKRRRADRTKVLWQLRVPSGGIQYYESCVECMKFKFCACCMPYDEYTLTMGDLQVDMRPPRRCWQWCIPTELAIKDLRFLKDVDTEEVRGFAPFCCLKKRGMTVKFHQEDKADMVEGEEHLVEEHAVKRTKFTIWHPLMTHEKAEELLAVWAEVRLVGD